MTTEKNLAHLLRYDLVQLRGNSCSSTSLKKSQVSWTKFRDKLQFVNSVQRLVFDLMKITFLKRLINIYRLIVEVLNDQNLFTESNWDDWLSSYVQFRQSRNVNHLKLIKQTLCDMTAFSSLITYKSNFCLAYS